MPRRRAAEVTLRAACRPPAWASLGRYLLAGLPIPALFSAQVELRAEQLEVLGGESAPAALALRSRDISRHRFWTYVPRDTSAASDEHPICQTCVTMSKARPVGPASAAQAADTLGRPKLGAARGAICRRQEPPERQLAEA